MIIAVCGTYHVWEFAVCWGCNVGGLQCGESVVWGGCIVRGVLVMRSCFVGELQCVGLSVPVCESCGVRKLRRGKL